MLRRQPMSLVLVTLAVAPAAVATSSGAPAWVKSSECQAEDGAAENNSASMPTRASSLSKKAPPMTKSASPPPPGSLGKGLHFYWATPIMRVQLAPPTKPHTFEGVLGEVASSVLRRFRSMERRERSRGTVYGDSLDTASDAFYHEQLEAWDSGKSSFLEEVIEGLYARVHTLRASR